MSQDKKFNGLQIFAMILMGMGLSFVLAPTSMGFLAIRSIVALILICGILGAIFGFFVHSKSTILTCSFITLLSIYFFRHPESVLYLIGISFLIAGINNFFLFFKTLNQADEKTTVSSIILILLGVFSILNANAALNTIIIILGIILSILGIVLFIIGKCFKKSIISSFYHQSSFHSPEHSPQNNNSRKVMVHIDGDDEVEEVEYKDL